MDLRGLDYFNQGQAAQYMCRSLSKFKQTVKALRIPHFYVDGIKMFRKTDLQNAIEKERRAQWQHSENEENHTISAGPSRGRTDRRRSAGRSAA